MVGSRKIASRGRERWKLRLLTSGLAGDGGVATAAQLGVER
jgi:hypothetical protein